jgi:hypothetical protein
MLSSLLFGDIIRRASLSSSNSSGWRNVFYVASIIQGSALVLYMVCRRLLLSEIYQDKNLDTIKIHSKTIAEVNENFLVKQTKRIIESNESVLTVLYRISRDQTFWLILAGRISLVTVRQFSVFLPFYLTTGSL